MPGGRDNYFWLNGILQSEVGQNRQGRRRRSIGNPRFGRARQLVMSAVIPIVSVHLRGGDTS